MKKCVLLIIDGLALGEKSEWNAFENADTHFLKKLLKLNLHSRLKTYGRWVGLPDNQTGNSEVGHMNLGAGRIVKQQQILIDEQIENLSLFENEEFKSCSKNSEINVITLVSSGGVHSHVRHLKKFDEFLQKNSLKGFLHVVTDGRDTPPRYFLDDWSTLNLEALSPVSVIGRYYAMDRDKRWDRTKTAYELIVYGKGRYVEVIEQAVEDFYSRTDKSDEFFDPYVIGNFQGLIFQQNPVVVFLNFREDRMRQLATALCETSNEVLPREKIFPKAFSLTEYDKSFTSIKPLFKFSPIKNTLGETLALKGLRQLRVAETEKYPHVTYFFSGGRETPFPKEDRILVPSPRDVPTYDLKPEMSVNEVTNVLIKELGNDYSLIVANFANCDMVGHTGSMHAAIKACEAVDKCAANLYAEATKRGYWLIITSDHGNCECMWDEKTGQCHTSHTKNDVFCLIINPQGDVIPSEANGLLASVAPTVLKILDLPQPVEMDCKPLI
ncbi:MAG: 2,3-bisphosphoglycerate-independent phosphoglycerate mutase [Deltaproteobacteria bacterium]|nr:2,3-bisphosphoglycerate-independent phosphoglycerate mutase [Deltaproteobacteria bacterium]MCX7952121.1 2,3-bisphosphoglycerate-independent phosphoglycerate mutase [Deltaproteobacteria bacterium]